MRKSSRILWYEILGWNCPQNAKHADWKWSKAKRDSKALLISCNEKFLKEEHFHAKHGTFPSKIRVSWDFSTPVDAGRNEECLQQWKSTLTVLKNVSCQYRIYTFLKDIWAVPSQGYSSESGNVSVEKAHNCSGTSLVVLWQEFTLPVQRV